MLSKFYQIKKSKNICLVNSNYSLLLYLIINNDEDTFFILGGGVSSTVRVNIKNGIYIRNPPKNKILRFIFLFIYYFLFSPVLKFFTKDKVFFGHDHVFFSNLLTNEYYVIEDGLGNYITNGPIHNMIINKLIGVDKCIGYSKRAVKVFLTGMTTIPFELIDKSEIIDIDNLWKRKTKSDKDSVNNIFRVDNDLFKVECLLLTQPLSEDGYIKETDKIKIYNDILKQDNIKYIVIKRHPRDKTDYFFGSDIDVKYIPSHIPMELLLLNKFSANTVYTLYSSSIFMFTKSNKKFIGTDRLIHHYPRLPLVSAGEFNE